MLGCLATSLVPAQNPSAPKATSARSVQPPLPKADFALLLELERQAEAATTAVAAANNPGSAERRADDAPFLLQQLSWARSVAGDYAGALVANQRGMAVPGRSPIIELPTREEARETIQGYQAVDAIATIVEAARDRQIVILNEAHHVARHRAFAMQLAAELRKLGFEYLACETFSPELDAAALRQRGYARKTDGFYVHEPLFADFVRQSLKIGYIPVAYESIGRGAGSDNPTDSINARETGEAANLVERIFKRKPDARVLIYVGYSHLRKEPENRPADPSHPVRWMAGRLKALTGIDPLTIDQTMMTDPAPDSMPAVFLQEIFGRGSSAGASLVLRRATDPKFLVLGAYAHDADIQVFHAPTAYPNGRPDWLALAGYRKPREVPAELRPKSGRRLVQAFATGETDAPIAVDQFVMDANQSPPRPFMLPEGEFRFAFEDGPSVDAGASAGDYFYDIAMPGPPFSVVMTHDQQRAFVSLVAQRNGKPMGITILRRDHDRFSLERTIATPAVTQGLVLTHDGKTLVATAGNAVLLLDVERMTRDGDDPVVAKISYDDTAGSVYVNVTSDDSVLFVADERAARITVVDLRRVRAEGFTPAAIIGRVPVGHAPIALTFSPDGRRLYTTSQVAPAEWGWPKTVHREGQPAEGAPLVPEGAVVVIDVEKAKRDPEHSVIARVPAGGSPVRLALSPEGDRAYVTARNSDALLVFDTARLAAGAADARIASVPVGSAPVGVLVAEAGRRIFVTNSNRFGADADRPATFAIVDAAKVEQGAAAVIATLPAGAFPREWCLAADGRTVLLTNFRSRTVRVIDTSTMPGH